MTRNALKLPSAQVNLTLEQLARMQRPAATHLTFSLTLACPLRCAHCIVDASPDKGSTTMPLHIAERYAEQFGELAGYGMRALSFTGGEPFLAHRQLRVMSDAGHAAGLITGVVTAAHWARNDASAAKIVREFPGIDVWDISLDTYHLEYVSLANVRAAFEAVRNAGKRATIRFAHEDPMSEADLQVLEQIGSFATQAELCCQRVRKVGRGDAVVQGYGQRYHPWNKPCVTQGMVVRYDGKHFAVLRESGGGTPTPFPSGKSSLENAEGSSSGVYVHALASDAAGRGISGCDAMAAGVGSGRRVATAPAG